MMIIPEHIKNAILLARAANPEISDEIKAIQLKSYALGELVAVNTRPEVQQYIKKIMYYFKQGDYPKANHYRSLAMHAAGLDDISNELNQQFWALYEQILPPDIYKEYKAFDDQGVEAN